MTIWIGGPIAMIFYCVRFVYQVKPHIHGYKYFTKQVWCIYLAFSK